jgi:NDP-sugar pyrophosphorylase family protein
MKAMIFAAGLGTRLKPFTDHHPKALAVVNGKSLLQRNVLYLQQYGITEVIVNVHHFAGQIIDAISNNKGWGSNITISNETSEVLETGGGLKKAAWYFAGETDFVVMNADILTNMNLHAMIQQHQHNQPLATLAVTQRTSSRYFLFNQQQRLCGWQNTKTNQQRLPLNSPQPLVQKAFSGIHVISTQLLPLITQQGKFSMVEVYLQLAASHTIQSYDHTGTILLDVGKPESLQAAATLFA